MPSNAEHRPLNPDRPPATARPMTRAEARNPEVAVRCRHCKAQAGNPCTNQRGTTPASEQHPGRRDDWTVVTVDCADCGAPIGTSCTPEHPAIPLRGPHKARVAAADIVYARALEDASRNMPGRKR
ncbi:zinc finger domain-containing protein [Streptomyces sp. Midd1]|uniref:zinc finger domain-containing protein n=1 Tax=Streptomyces sp. Midd3 TaxID=3161191 RepID=UPI0034DAD365